MSNIRSESKSKPKESLPVTFPYRFCVINRREKPCLVIETQGEKYHAIYKIDLDKHGFKEYIKLRAYASESGLADLLQKLKQEGDLLWLLNKDVVLKPKYKDFHFVAARPLTDVEEKAELNPESRAVLMKATRAANPVKQSFPPKRPAPKKYDHALIAALEAMTPDERNEFERAKQREKKQDQQDLEEQRYAMDNVKSAMRDPSLCFSDEELLKYQVREPHSKLNKGSDKTKNKSLSGIDLDEEWNSIPDTQSNDEDREEKQKTEEKSQARKKIKFATDDEWDLIPGADDKDEGHKNKKQRTEEKPKGKSKEKPKENSKDPKRAKTAVMPTLTQAETFFGRKVPVPAASIQKKPSCSVWSVVPKTVSGAEANRKEHGGTKRKL